MNHTTRSMLGCLGLVLLLPLLLTACNCTPCERKCDYWCEPHPIPGMELLCIQDCVLRKCPLCVLLDYLGLSQACEENPDECVATFGYYQDAVIQICEEYPEECQQAFDSWVESVDTDAKE